MKYMLIALTAAALSAVILTPYAEALTPPDCGKRVAVHDRRTSNWRCVDYPRNMKK